MSNDAADRAHETAKRMEAEYHGCASCILAALQDAFDERDDAVFRSATGLSGGGLAGAAMSLGQLLGRDRAEFTDTAGARNETSRVVGDLRARFVERYGPVVRADIQSSVIGRPFDRTNADDVLYFWEAGGHPVHSPEVVGLPIRWAAEVVFENNLAPACDE